MEEARRLTQGRRQLGVGGRGRGRLWGQGSGTRAQARASGGRQKTSARPSSSRCRDWTMDGERVAQRRVAEEYVKEARVGDGDGPRVLIDID
jgi:hypothetical protein